VGFFFQLYKFRTDREKIVELDIWALTIFLYLFYLWLSFSTFYFLLSCLFIFLCIFYRFCLLFNYYFSLYFSLCFCLFGIFWLIYTFPSSIVQKFSLNFYLFVFSVFSICCNTVFSYHFILSSLPFSISVSVFSILPVFSIFFSYLLCLFSIWRH
jgi:hypothetical protein